MGDLGTLPSAKIGTLPILGDIFDGGFWNAFFWMFILDFLTIFLLMWGEYVMSYAGSGVMPPWRRSHYATFIINDTVVITTYLGIVAIILERGPSFKGYWFTETWWHLLLLAVGFGMSLLLELHSMRIGQFTWAEELSPSKLWHTFIFGIVAYWLLASLPATILLVFGGYGSVGLTVILAGCVVVFFLTSWYDALNRPFPEPHVEWNWKELKGELRFQMS